MKRYSLTVLLALLAFTALVPAQPLRGSYFFETSLLRSKLNPAFAPQTDLYISVPVAGYASADILSNVGLGNFLFADGDKNYTFLNDRVDANTFYAKLPQKDPYLRAQFETDLVGGGYRLNEKLYLTASLSVAGNASALIPQELLRFAKTGRSGATQSWHIQNLNANVAAWAVLAAGASYDLGDWVPGLTVGGRLKLMTGLKGASATLQMADISLTDERISAETRGESLLAGFSYDSEAGFRNEGFGLRGFGAAVDLGAEYRLRFDGFVNGLNLSASIRDLGALSFGGASKLAMAGIATYQGLGEIDFDADLQKRFQEVLDGFSGLANLSNVGNEPLRVLPGPAVCAGIEAPFLNEMLSAGLLYTYNLGKSHLTLAFNATPLDWLNLSANYTFGPSNTFGFYAEYIPAKYVSVFLGFEKASWKTNKHLLGIHNFTESLCFGLNVLL